MSGGVEGKLGVWYEHDVVCYFWLRLLAEHVQELVWEPRNSAGEAGVDILVTEDDRRVAYQVKKKDTGSWSPSELAGKGGKKGVLEYAREQLTRECPVDEYVLFTTTSAPGLEKLLEWARSEGPLSALHERAEGEACKLLGRSDLEGHEDELRSLGSRIRVETMNATALSGVLQDSARDLVGDQADILLNSLRASRGREKFERTWTSRSLRLELESLKLSWNTTPDKSTALERIEEYCASFLNEAEMRRPRGLELEDRAEVEELLDVLGRADEGELILVHGPAGSGKSDVLAQVIGKWRGELGWVLPILADRADALLECQPSFTRMALVARLGQLTLFIDQLDQLMLSGPDVGEKTRAVVRLLHQARRHGCRVVIGCRTVDARHETQLHKLFLRDEERQAREVMIGELPEVEVADKLAATGVPWASLSTEVQELVRRPVCLGFALGLAGSGGWQGAANVYDLAHAWLRFVTAGDRTQYATFEALADRIESDGDFRVNSRLLVDHAVGLEVLRRAGVVLFSGNQWQPVHQVLIDMRLARRIGECEDLACVLERLGSKQQQGIAQARRLRHAALLLADRGPLGPQVLNGVFLSDEVRPLAKRALLLGLGDVAPSKQVMVEEVMGWLKEPDLGGLVVEALLRGHGPWTEAVRPWIERAWSEADGAYRNALLGLLASVSTQSGDLVAELLAEWSKEDATLLSRTDRIFMANPSDDSEALFEMRLKALGHSGAERRRPYPWEELLRKVPGRAARLFGALLPGVGEQALLRATWNVGRDLPSAQQFSPVALEHAQTFWDELCPWWLGLDAVELRSVEVPRESGNAPVLVEVVDILARCLAHLLDQEKLSWKDIVADLPDPLRELDGWLLLVVGARLEGGSERAVVDAAEWLIENEVFCGLRIDERSYWGNFELLRAFMRGVAPRLPDLAYERLESWVLRYRDPWSSEDEEVRRNHERETGRFYPNRLGAMALFVLRELKEAVGAELSAKAAKLLEQLKRKFSPFEEALFSSVSSKGGWGGSSVSSEKLEAMDAEELSELLESARLSNGTWKLAREGEQFEEFSWEALVRQIGCLIRANPGAWISRAASLAEHFDPDAGGSRSLYDLHSIIVDSVADGARATASVESDDGRVGEAELARFAQVPAILKNPSCAAGLARLVGGHAMVAWPEVVVQRLVALADSQTPSGSDPTGREDEAVDPLDFALLNDAHCVALDALASLAEHHAELQENLRSVAGKVIEREDPASRAAAAVLAWCCGATDSARSKQLFLKACEDTRVAGSRKCFELLFQLILSSETRSEEQGAAVAALRGLALSSIPWTAAQGGRALVALMRHERATSDELVTALRQSKLVQRGAASELVQLLPEWSSRPWMLAAVRVLVEDASERVGGVVVRAAARHQARAMLQDPELASDLIKSPAGQAHRGILLSALDEEAHLHPAGSVILELAKGLNDADGAELDALYQRQWLQGMLARLIGECERRSDWSLRVRALDAWDRLISSRPREVSPLFEQITR